MKISDKSINDSSPCFIVAEMSGNHNGKLELAIETIISAKKAGADAIKLQTYTADTITLNIRNKNFMINQGTAWDGEYYYDLYEKAHTPWDWHPELFRIAKEEGIICFSSPFDKTAVDLLEGLNAPAYKIASFEITDIQLIAYAASKGKPIIISNGIATEEEIALAINTCKNAGNHEIAILKCTSEYPAPPHEANLLTIPAIRSKFDVIAGLSDHTIGIEAPVAAVALGAKIIEKHFILDRSLGGVDSHFSLDAIELKQMVEAIRRTEDMLGKVDFSLSEKQMKSRLFSRSLFAIENIKAGELFTEKNIRSVRPGIGMHPKHLKIILGKTAKTDIERGTPISDNLINDWKVQ